MAFGLFKRKKDTEKRYSESGLAKFVKKTLKDKSLSANEKYEKIVKVYDEYLAGRLPLDANMATFELHYEQFMIYDEQLQKDVKHEFKYQKCFEEELANKFFYHFCSLYKITNVCKEMGLDESKLSDLGKEYYDGINYLDEQCNFESALHFDDSESKLSPFYSDNKVRSLFVKHMNILYDKLLDENIKRSEEETVEIVEE